MTDETPGLFWGRMLMWSVVAGLSGIVCGSLFPYVGLTSNFAAGTAGFWVMLFLAYLRGGQHDDE